MTHRYSNALTKAHHRCPCLVAITLSVIFWPTASSAQETAPSKPKHVPEVVIRQLEAVAMAQLDYGFVVHAVPMPLDKKINHETDVPEAVMKRSLSWLERILTLDVADGKVEAYRQVVLLEKRNTQGTVSRREGGDFIKWSTRDDLERIVVHEDGERLSIRIRLEHPLDVSFADAQASQPVLNEARRILRLPADSTYSIEKIKDLEGGVLGIMRSNEKPPVADSEEAKPRWWLTVVFIQMGDYLILYVAELDETATQPRLRNAANLPRRF